VVEHQEGTSGAIRGCSRRCKKEDKITQFVAGSGWILCGEPPCLTQSGKPRRRTALSLSMRQVITSAIIKHSVYNCAYQSFNIILDELQGAPAGREVTYSLSRCLKSADNISRQQKRHAFAPYGRPGETGRLFFCGSGRH
jgi:hypothetical protein